MSLEWVQLIVDTLECVNQLIQVLFDDTKGNAILYSRYFKRVLRRRFFGAQNYI